MELFRTLITTSLIIILSMQHGNTVESKIIDFVNKSKTEEIIAKINQYDFTKSSKENSARIMQSQEDLSILEKIIKTGKAEIGQSYNRNGVYLMSLIYENSKNWISRINGKIFTQETEDYINQEISILKIEKNYIIFKINNVNQEKIDKINKIKSEGGSYISSYFVVPVQKSQINALAFKLYVGQEINLETFRIKDVYIGK